MPMGKIIKQTGNEMKERWHQKMPPFFYWMVVIACGVGGTAAAINLGLPMVGGTHSEWWDSAFRYIFSTCIGVVFACKFTVAGGYKNIDPDKIIRGGKAVERGSKEPNMSDIETEQPSDMVDDKED